MKSIRILFLFILFFSASLFATVIKHDYPRICPRSDEYNVKIDGGRAFVYHTSAGNFVSFETDSEVTIQVETPRKSRNINVLPRRLDINPGKEDNTFSFQLPVGEKVLIEIDNLEPLFVYSNTIAVNKPNPEAPGVRYYKSGQVYEVGQLKLTDNETLYIEGGAVVRGTVLASSAKNVHIFGYGVLDGGYFRQYGEHSHHVRLEDCRDARVEDIIMIEPPGWMLVLYFSENIAINNIKELGEGAGTDGVDIVGSRHVRIENSIMRNGDDCIVIKFFVRDNYIEPVLNKIEGPSDIEVRGCSLQANNGQVFEIGHELIVNPVKDIRFIDCDVLGAHGHAGVFGIHNCDGATVSDVLYQDIRVDHYYSKLIDMRIIKSRWSKEDKIGYVNNVVFKDIKVTSSIYNPGYSISLIGGYDDQHQINNVTIEDFYINGVKVTNADQLDLYVKQANHVVIK